MAEIRKRIAALSLATSMLIGTTGCSSNTIKKTIDKSGVETYSGEITLSSIDNLYIIEIKNLSDETQLYLTREALEVKGDFSSYNEYIILGTNIELTHELKGYNCDYGEVINVVPLKQFISSYVELKETYTAEEIVNIFESIKDDYNNLITKEDVKKLELKK